MIAYPGLKDLRRIWSMRPLRIVAAVYVASGVALWPVPLFNVLHVESAAVLALVAWFAAGISSIALFRRHGIHRAAVPLVDGKGIAPRHTRPTISPAFVLTGQLLLLLVPLFLLTATLLWASNCSYPTGLMFFGLFPGVSVVLATGIAYFISALQLKRPFFAFAAIGLAICLLTPLYDLGLYPQLYTYNHVFGGVLGPIYDEELALRPGLFAHRLLSLLWAALAFLAGTILQRRVRLGHPLTAAAAGISIIIALAYVSSNQLGWNTTPRTLKETLGGYRTSAHFEVFYSGESFLSGELDRLMQDMEYRYDAISGALDEEVEEPIAVYLYPTAEIKGALTGSRYTSVTPVWLRTPQIHMLARRLEQSFDHELVHVFSREFGLPVVKASFAVGLVEGLAAALEAPDGGPSASDLMAATVHTSSRDSADVVEELVASLSPLGFWTGRGAVSYAVNGSFVDYLLRAYGPERFKQAYPTSDFVEAYGRDKHALAAEWYQDLRATETYSEAALPMAIHRFAIPSLFETECPHTVPDHVRAYRAASDRLAVHDSLAVLQALQRSVALSPDYLPAAVALASLLVRRGDAGSARAVLPTDSVSRSYPVVAVLTADLAGLEGNEGEARRLYDAALDSLPTYAEEARASVLLRRHALALPGALRWMLVDEATEEEPPAVSADPAAPTILLRRHTRRMQFGMACDAGLEHADYLEAAFETAASSLLQRRHLLWLGEACENAGRLGSAQDAYARARLEYAAAGGVDTERLASDRWRRVQWKLSKEDGRKTPSAPPQDLKRPSP